MRRASLLRRVSLYRLNAPQTSSQVPFTHTVAARNAHGSLRRHRFLKQSICKLRIALLNQTFKPAGKKLSGFLSYCYQFGCLRDGKKNGCVESLPYLLPRSHGWHGSGIRPMPKFKIEETLYDGSSVVWKYQRSRADRYHSQFGDRCNGRMLFE